MADDLFLLFIAPLNRVPIPYMVTGSAAVTVYGEPRLTNDVDIVIALNNVNAGQLAALYPGETFYFPPQEVIQEELRRSSGGGFNVIHHATGFKADFYLTQDPLHRWGMERRSCVEIDGENVWLAPPEYVIIRKMQFYREGGSEKHLRDISGIMQVSPDLVDGIVLSNLVDEYGLRRIWEKLKM
jgi:hypothetical protein